MKQRFSKNQEEVIRIFVSSSFDDGLSIMAAVHYMKVVIDHMAETVKVYQIEWEPAALDLAMEASIALQNAKIFLATHQEDDPFIAGIQQQVSKLHPLLTQAVGQI